MFDLKHVLFVCTGNTCRSPLAEGLFRLALAGRDDYRVGSAGVAAVDGGPASAHTLAVLRRRGGDLAGFASRGVTAGMLDEATHVFGMTRGHLAVLAECFPEHADKLFLTCEFIDLPGLGVGADVPDPIGMGRDAYEEVAQVLERAVPAIIQYIDRTWKPAAPEG